MWLLVIFFFNDPATTEFYTLSLPDALPIPLAFTKTFALLASIVIALTVIPPGALILFTGKVSSRKLRQVFYGILAFAAAAVVIHGVRGGSFVIFFGGMILTAFAVHGFMEKRIPEAFKSKIPLIANILVVTFIGVLLSVYWEPLGPQRGPVRNFIFVVALVGILIGFFKLFILVYPTTLRWALAHKIVLLSSV